MKFVLVQKEEHCHLQANFTNCDYILDFFFGLNCSKFKETNKHTEPQNAFFFLFGLFGNPNSYHDNHKEFSEYLFKPESKEFDGIQIRMNISTILHTSIKVNEELYKAIAKEMTLYYTSFVDVIKEYSLQKYGKAIIPKSFMFFNSYEVIKKNGESIESYENRQENYEILIEMFGDFLKEEKNTTLEDIPQEKGDELFWSEEFEEYTKNKFRPLFLEFFGYKITDIFFITLYDYEKTYEENKEMYIKGCQFFYDNADKYPKIAKIYKVAWGFGKFIWSKKLTIRDCSYNIQGRIIR